MSRTSIFRTKRYVRNISYFIITICSLPLSYLILLANEAQQLVSSVGGQSAGASLFWFYIGSRITDTSVQREPLNKLLVRIYGVLMIISGIMTVYLSEYNYDTNHIYQSLGISQIVFGLFAAHIINNRMKKNSQNRQSNRISSISKFIKSVFPKKVSNKDLSKLDELGKLKEKGVITEIEFEKLKSEIINR